MVAKNAKVNEKVANRVLTAFEMELFNALLKGNSYSIRNIGRVKVVKAKELSRKCKWGLLTLPEHYTVTFKRSRVIYEALRKYNIKNQEDEGEDEFAIFE